jgi:cysteine desulfuration protein SufE
MSIAEKEIEIVDDFAIYDDWMEKYEYIIELGKDLPIIDSDLKTNDRIIKGCQSQVWLNAEKIDDKIKFTADADAIIAKGIISLLIQVLSDETPEDILDAKLDFIKEIGLQEHLSPTRSNGLVSMVKQMKTYALALK